MIIFGKNMVLEALKSNKSIEKVFVTKNNLELVKKYENKFPIFLKTQNEIDALAKGLNQGIIAFVKEYEYQDLKQVVNKLKNKQDVCLCILDGLEDPHNLGAILRTADATGIDGIIIPKNRSVSLNDTVAKVSTGAIEHVNVMQVTNLTQTMDYLKENGYWIYGLEASGDKNYTDYDYSGKCCLVIGSEGKGISNLVTKNCDFLLRIPMIGHVNSLNASVSASLMFYEVLRNRK